MNSNSNKTQHHFALYAVFLLILLPFILCARQIDTFYGPIEVQEPVLLELIDSPIFQRLKHIHQYGVAYFTTHKEEYTRYDHSLGVFTLLRTKGAPIEEQIAGLLHDVSHTAFSHVGDWIFGKENQVNNYQDSIHAKFLKESGLDDILKKYHFTIEQILPMEELFPALDNELPNLCADRIDYNIQGAYHQGFITYNEAVLIFKNIYFKDNRWISSYPELMKKLTLFSLFMTQDCWGSPSNYVTSRWLADAILRGVDLGSISFEEIHLGTDLEIWIKLMVHKDSIIQKKMNMIVNSHVYFSVVDDADKADYIVKSKFRGIDPWVKFESNCIRLTELDANLNQEFQRVKQIVNKGWPIKILGNT